MTEARKSGTRRKTFIKQWRNYRGLSLEKLSHRMESDPSGKSLTAASLSRIENGSQNTGHETLKAIADALSCRPTDLIQNDPNQCGDIVDIWMSLEDDEKEISIIMLKALSEKRRRKRESRGS